MIAALKVQKSLFSHAAHFVCLSQAKMQSSYSSPTMFGAAAFATNASSYSYELLWPLSMDVYQVVDALDGVDANSL